MAGVKTYALCVEPLKIRKGPAADAGALCGGEVAGGGCLWLLPGFDGEVAKVALALELARLFLHFWREINDAEDEVLVGAEVLEGDMLPCFSEKVEQGTKGFREIFALMIVVGEAVDCCDVVKSVGWLDECDFPQSGDHCVEELVEIGRLIFLC